MARLVSDICAQASMLIGATQLGVSLTSDESTAILNTWQMLIDSYGLDRANIHTIRQDTYALVAGQQTYTIGFDPRTSTTGQWGANRPNDIERMKLVLQPGIYTEMWPMDVDEFADISFATVNSIPSRYYYDADAPLAKFYIYPIPSQAFNVVVYSTQNLEGVLNLTDTVAFAQGYERYWAHALAVEIAPIFGLEPSPTLVVNANDAKAKIQGSNRKSPRILSDPGLVKPPGGYFNYRSGLNQ